MQKCMIMLLVLVMLLSMTACKDQASEAQIEFFENEGNSTDLTDQTNENIWEEEAIGADNTVAVHIRHIREKIEINPKEPKYLKVVWGVGYKIEKL